LGKEQKMSDLSTTVQSAFDYQQGEFLNVELSTCSRSANLASKMYRAGNTVAAERTTADAEKCYAMAFRFLSDPKDSRHLTTKSIQEFTVKMEALRTTLDGLQRLRK